MFISNQQHNEHDIITLYAPAIAAQRAHMYTSSFSSIPLLQMGHCSSLSAHPPQHLRCLQGLKTTLLRLDMQTTHRPADRSGRGVHAWEG